MFKINSKATIYNLLQGNKPILLNRFTEDFYSLQTPMEVFEICEEGSLKMK